MRRLLLGLLPLLLAPTVTLAQPDTRYQGFLADSGGDPVNGTVTMYFKLYADETGGTALFLQQINDVSIVAGNFALDLDLEAADLEQSDLWMALAMDEQDNEMPRQRVASVPWAFLCGEAETLDGVPATGYQARVSGDCNINQFIRQIRNDGTVVCEDDDAGVAGGVDTLTAGAGLVGDVPEGAVTLDVNVGVGLTAAADSVGVNFGGSGFLDEVARSGHGHSAYVPVGNLSCPPSNLVTGLDTGFGDVACAPDTDSTYSGILPAGNVFLGSGNQFDLAANLTVQQSVTADRYFTSGLRTGHYSIHPADFDPEDSDFPEYIAPGQSPAYLRIANSTDVLAPVNLPQDAMITNVEFYYVRSDAASDLSCSLDAIDTSTSVVTNLWLEPATDSSGLIIHFISAPVGGHRVDNSTNAYVASCRFNDTAGEPSLFLYGYIITYQYDELLR